MDRRRVRTEAIERRAFRRGRHVNSNSIDETCKNPAPHLMSQFEIEITLAKGCMPGLGSPNYQINGSLLVDEAFRPKIYTVRLEKSNFLCAYVIMLPKEDEVTPRFALRRAYNELLYPPR